MKHLLLYIVVLASIAYPTLSGKLISDSKVNIESKTSGTVVNNRSECPFQVSLQFRGAHLCGGVILDRANILTTAHCVFGIPLSMLTIKSGHLLNSDNSATVSNITKVVIHDSYEGGGAAPFDNNVAIVQLEGLLKESSDIGLVQLAPETVKDDSAVIAYGWGANTQNGLTSDELKRAVVKTVNVDSCNRTYRGLLPKNVFCAKFEEGDTCRGDDGGAVVDSEGRLIGIVLYSPYNTCNHPVYPRAYVDITKYSSWISEHKQDDGTSASSAIVANIFLIILALLMT